MAFQCIKSITCVSPIISVLNDRRRTLEVQIAQRGIDTPHHILADIRDISNQIRSHEEAIVELEAYTPEDDWLEIESDYRILLIKEWSTPRGRPSVIGRVLLEKERLRLGLKADQAKNIEQEVRTDLAKETISSISGFVFSRLTLDIPIDMHAQDMMLIGRVINLEPSIALQWLIASWPKDVQTSTSKFSDLLLRINGIWPTQEEHPVFTKLLKDLEETISKQHQY